METRSGLAWSPPANAIGCSFDYVVTEDGSELTRTADISYNYTFPACQDLTITVTPVVPSTGQVLTSSSASINVLNFSFGQCANNSYVSTSSYCLFSDIVGTKPDVTVSRVQIGHQFYICITWILLVSG